MARQRILVVDDEEDIRELVSYALRRESYEVLTAPDGETALARAKERRPDLIILDLMLPGIDGIEVCRRLREDQATKGIPVIMLTAKVEESDVVIGLGVGADDYVTKPFSPRILLARVRTVLRRSGPGEERGDRSAVCRGKLTITPSRHEVLLGGQEIKLTPLEFNILYCLARRPGRVFTRNQIIDVAQGEGVIVTERTIDVHIVALRKKMGDAAGLVETVRGIGYKFRG